MKWQHKKCAELLRDAIEKGACSTTIATYNTWAEWMQIATICSPTQEMILNRYHAHSKKAGLHIKEHNLPQVLQGDTRSPEQYLPIVIYLDNLRSAHNVGSIIRTTEAFRLGKLALSPTTPTPKEKPVRDTSMKADEWVAWETVQDLAFCPRPVIALETTSDSTPLHNTPLPSSFTLVIGNEEYGCSTSALSQADQIISIPLYGRKNSLNVANAFAIAAAEITRQLRNGYFERNTIRRTN